MVNLWKCNYLEQERYDLLPLIEFCVAIAAVEFQGPIDKICEFLHFKLLR